MVGYRRNLIPGGTYFFTVNLADRRSRILVDRIAILRGAFRETWRKRPFTIDAIVVLPDHLHAIFTLPAGDADFSARWRHIKGYFTSRLLTECVPIGRRSNNEAALWQRRFWEHTIKNEADFARHVDYIHFNPMKHRIVTRLLDWPHSSFHRFVRRGLLAEDWAGDTNESGLNFGEPNN